MATFNGTSGSDTLAGGAGADRLVGGAGNDTYLVNSLGDVVVEAAGGGTDRIVTSVLDAEGIYALLPWPEVEHLRYSGALAATLIGNALSNRIEANAATATADHLAGGAGNDSLFGHAGADLLAGGSGRDLLDGGTGADRMLGGSGDDVYVVDNAGDRIAEFAGGGRDLIRSRIAFDLGVDWAGEVEDLTYTGTAAATLAGNDLDNVILSLGGGADALSGGAGDDTLAGGGGADTLAGGEGDDVYRLGTGDVVVEAAGEGRDTFEGTRTSIASGSAAAAIENLIYTGAVGAALTGNGLSNVIEGGAGADTVSGSLGDDSLAGGAGADRLYGGSGSDRLFGGAIPGLSIGRSRVNDSAIDRLAGGADSDVYYLSDTSDLVIEGADEGTLDVVVSAVSNRLSRYANVEALVLETRSGAYAAAGSDGADILIGNEAGNLISGGLGNDTLAGWGLSRVAGAADILQGGGGQDVLLAHAFTGAAAAVDLTLDGGAGNDLYLVGDGVPVAGWDAGGSDTAVIFGAASLARLSGVETISLYGADEAVDEAARTALALAYAAITGGDADLDALAPGRDATGNDLANTIIGNALANRLSGGAGNDTIRGGDGADTLIGGAGVDHLTGGRGDDTYQIDSGDLAVEAAGGGFDVIRSSTISSLDAFAHIEGLLFTGSAAVNLNRGSMNTSADLLGGGSGGDTVAGFGGADSLYGGAGNDSLYGGSGADRLWGDDGDDLLEGGDADDSLFGGNGRDTLSGGNNWDSLSGGAGADLLLGGVGNDTLIGGAGADTLDGEGANDRIEGGAGNDLIRFGDFTQTGAGNGDHLFGDDPGDPAALGADRFLCTTVLAASGVTETFVGSGVFHYANGATISDFQPGIDRFGLAAAYLGDFDAVIDGTSATTMAGEAFSASDEIVFFRADVAESFAPVAGAVFDPILMDPVVSVIGTASAALAVNETRLFVMEDGTSSAVFLFQSADGNAVVTGDELYLLAVITGADALQPGDFFLA